MNLSIYRGVTHTLTREVRITKSHPHHHRPSVFTLSPKKREETEDLKSKDPEGKETFYVWVSTGIRDCKVD